MNFKEFDLSDYINALEYFKSNQTETVIQHWGSIENFDMFIQKIKDDEDQVAKLAIQQFASIEEYTKEMRHNLEHFSEIPERQLGKSIDLFQISGSSPPSDLHYQCHRGIQPSAAEGHEI